MMFVALHYTLGITTWGVSSSSPAVLDTWEQIVLFNVYSEINQKRIHIRVQNPEQAPPADILVLEHSKAFNANNNGANLQSSSYHIF